VRLQDDLFFSLILLILLTKLDQIVIRTDTDGDMKISTKELPLLALRLQILLEPYGINLDTNKFQAMIEEDNGE